MTSEQISVYARNLFVKEFTLRIIQNLSKRKFYHRNMEFIDADLVPRIVEKGKPSLMHNFENTEEKKLVEPFLIPQKRTIKKIPKKIIVPISKIKKPILKKPHLLNLPEAPDFEQKKITHEFPKTIPHPFISLPKVSTPSPPREKLKREIRHVPSPVKSNQKPMPLKKHINLPREKEKLAPLLSDPSIQSIECFGAGKPLMVLRGGQKQPTKTTLTEEEIKNYLESISKSTHIPLLEGIFRAVSGQFSVNAVVSEIVGSKFILKKHLFR